MVFIVFKFKLFVIVMHELWVCACRHGWNSVKWLQLKAIFTRLVLKRSFPASINNEQLLWADCDLHDVWLGNIVTTLMHYDTVYITVRPSRNSRSTLIAFTCVNQTEAHHSYVCNYCNIAFDNNFLCIYTVILYKLK